MVCPLRLFKNKLDQILLPGHNGNSRCTVRREQIHRPDLELHSVCTHHKLQELSGTALRRPQQQRGRGDRSAVSVWGDAPPPDTCLLLLVSLSRPVSGRLRPMRISYGQLTKRRGRQCPQGEAADPATSEADCLRRGSACGSTYRGAGGGEGGAAADDDAGGGRARGRRQAYVSDPQPAGRRGLGTVTEGSPTRN